jgi:two-component system, cell cycle sensor histidine kinase and response regulator CckA
MSGRELAQRLLAEKADLKVNYSSGYSADVICKDSLLVEGVNFLQKPYQAAQLAKAVQDCIGSRRSDS